MHCIRCVRERIHQSLNKNIFKTGIKQHVFWHIFQRMNGPSYTKTCLRGSSEFRKSRSACASAQSDLGPRCPLTEPLNCRLYRRAPSVAKYCDKRLVLLTSLVHYCSHIPRRYVFSCFATNETQSTKKKKLPHRTFHRLRSTYIPAVFLESTF